jgi:hypothetical protein
MKVGNLRRTVAFLAVVAAVGACGGIGDDQTRRDGASRAEPEEEPAVGDSASQDGDNPVVPGGADLDEALLTADDVPDGLIDLRLHQSAVEICGMRTEMPESGLGEEFPSAAAAFALDASPIVPDVLEKIVVAPVGTGTAVFQRAREHLDMNCSSGGEVDGLAFLSANELDVPMLGEDIVARRVTIEQLGTGTTVGVDILYARTGDTIVIVGVVEPEGQTDLLVELATLAFDRASAL